MADFDFAASRAYYAAFYAMEAALLTRNVTCSTHGGVLTAFSERFVKTGPLPSEFGSRAARLFRERQIGDYEFDVSVTKMDAEQDLCAAADMVEAIAALLQEGHFLPPAAVTKGTDHCSSATE